MIEKPARQPRSAIFRLMGTWSADPKKFFGVEDTLYLAGKNFQSNRSTSLEFARVNAMTVRGGPFSVTVFICIYESPNEVGYRPVENMDRGGTPQRCYSGGSFSELPRPISLGGSSNES